MDDIDRVPSFYQALRVKKKTNIKNTMICKSEYGRGSKGRHGPQSSQSHLRLEGYLSGPNRYKNETNSIVDGNVKHTLTSTTCGVSIFSIISCAIRSPSATETKCRPYKMVIGIR